MFRIIFKRSFQYLLVFSFLVNIMPLGIYADTQRTYAGQFTDVSSDAWYYESVAAAYEMGIIDGVNDTHYNPNGSVTLAECIKLAACIAQKQTEGSVSLTNGTEIWYEPYVQYALDNGILRENYDDYTIPAERAQVVQIFASVLAYNEPVVNTLGTLRFRDVADENMWYYEDVYRMYTHGIMVGDDTYCFNPGDAILRSEMAAVTVRMLDWDKRVARTITAPKQVKTAILMYHNFADHFSDFTITSDIFRSHLRVLSENGYESITFEELILYTEGKIPLPEKCVLLTADDGYSGVLDIALPLLEEFDMKMSVAVIGNMIGNQGDGTLTHFTLDEVLHTDTEGHIELISHSWGLHQTANGMDGAVNLTLTEEAYMTALEADRQKIADAAGDNFPMMNKVFVYPFGKNSEASETWFAVAGYDVTVTVERGVSWISVGETLRLLKRIPAEWYTTGEQLLRVIG